MNIKYTDQIGKEIEINHPAKRIVSLVPSQTELLFDLGLEDEVIGLTKFCIHPEKWFKNKTKIGGTKNPDVEKILSLEPDLIIANKEENMEEHIIALEAKVPVWTSDVKNFDEALDMIQSVGAITGKTEKAKELVDVISTNFELIEKVDGKTAAYLIWRNPYMTVGGDTFISDLITKVGFTNVFEKQHRYPQTIMEEIKNKKPDYLFLSSEPYPFKQEHIDELQKHLPNVKIMLIDGEKFSWYGSHLLKFGEYWNSLRPTL